MLLDLWPALSPEVLASIRRALATVLATIDGLQVYEFMPGHVIAPAAVISRDQGPRPDTFVDSRVTVGFVVTLLTALSDEHLGQKTSFTPLTVLGAIDADPTLGGVVEFADVTEVESDEIKNYGGLDYMTTALVVEVATF